MTIPAPAEAAIAYYMGEKGLSKDVATGIASVLYVESQLDPLAQNNSGTDKGGVLNPAGAVGIAQWNGPRQQALADFATKKVLDWKLLTTQLAFVLTEAANSYPQFWSAIQTPGISYSDIITAMVTHYEVPANIPAEIAKATALAKDWYSAVVEPTPPSPTPAPTPGPDPEIAALEQIWTVLGPLASASQKRIMTYLQSRVGT